MRAKLARWLLGVNNTHIQNQDSQKTNSEPTAGLIVQDADELLAPFKQNIEYIYSSVPVDRSYFNDHYLSAIRALCCYVQAFPASKSDHHNHKYGLLNHSLEVSLFATRLAKKYIYIDNDESSIAELEDRYTYACFTSALFHDAAKVLTDISTVYQTGNSDWQLWNPLNGPMPVGASYRYRYIDDRIYKAHQASAIILAMKCMKPGSLEWLKSNSRVFQHWCLSLTAHNEAAGEIGKVVAGADKISVGNNKVHNPATTMSEASPPIKDKFQQLISKIRHELESHEKINHAGNPYFITEHHVFLIHPKWTDSLIDDKVNARQEQNSMLNILSENENTITVEGRRALCRFMFALDSKENGQINDSILSAVVLRRTVIDVDRRLPTSEIKIKATSGITIPDELAYLQVKAIKNKDISDNNETNSKHSENKSLSHSVDPDNNEALSNNNDEYHQVSDTENILGEVDNHELEIYSAFMNHNNVEHSKNETDVTDNIITSKVDGLQRKNLEYKSQCESNLQKYDKTVFSFLLFIQEMTSAKNQLNKPHALIHKVNDSIYVVWPEACSRFWKKHKLELASDFEAVGNRSTSLEKHILSFNIQSKAPGNENFWKIQFRANSDAGFGLPLGVIRLADSIGNQSPFDDLPNNKTAKIIMK